MKPMPFPSSWSLVFAMALVGCVSETGPGPDNGDPSSVTSTPPGGETPTDTTLPMDFPCDVRAVLQTHCAGCHTGQVYAHRMDTRAALTKLFSDGNSMGSRLVTRLREGTMPPANAKTRPTAAEQEIVINWVEAGMPAGTCGALTPPPL